MAPPPKRPEPRSGQRPPRNPFVRFVRPAAAVVGVSAGTALVALRVLQGAALAGLPATAMAYLAEEVDQAHLGRAMGLYIAGNAIGGLSGRVVAGILEEHGGWRVAAVGVAGFALACAVAFALLLPRRRRGEEARPRGRPLTDTGRATGLARRDGLPQRDERRRDPALAR